MDDNTNLYNSLTACGNITCSGSNYFTPIQYIPTWTYDTSNITVSTSFLTKENNSDELKINIKKHQIKFNFNL